MDLKETYNKIASDWHEDHKTRDNWWIGGTDKFISFLKRGDLVLDVGCGGGIKSKYLAERGLRIVGIDFSQAMIEIAKKEVPLETFYVMDLSKADKLDYSFDGVFAQAVLLHVPKRELGEKLKELVARLKTGGYLYVAVKEKRPEGAEEEVKIESDYGYPYERFFSYFTVGEIKSRFEEIGFEVSFITITPWRSTRWIEVIGKKKESGNTQSGIN